MHFVDLVLAGADKSGILDRMDFMDLTDLKDPMDLMDFMDLTDLMELLLISADKSTYRYPIGAQRPDMGPYVHCLTYVRTYTQSSVFATQRVRHV